MYFNSYILIYCLYNFVEAIVRLKHHTELPVKYCAYQSLSREQILFPPSDHRTEDILLKISAVTLQQIVISNVQIKKKTIIEQKCKFIQDMFLILSNITSKSRWGRDFTPVQTDPGAHPTSCTIGNVSFPGVKVAGRGTDPHLLSRAPKS